MKKNVHFLWQQQHQEALEEKKQLCKAQIIIYYVIDLNTTTIFQCDVSTLGVEAWIRQNNERGAEKNSRNGIKVSHSNRVKVFQHRKSMPGSHKRSTKI